MAGKFKKAVVVFINMFLIQGIHRKLTEVSKKRKMDHMVALLTTCVPMITVACIL